MKTQELLSGIAVIAIFAVIAWLILGFFTFRSGDRVFKVAWLIGTCGLIATYFAGR